MTIGQGLYLGFQVALSVGATYHAWRYHGWPVGLTLAGIMAAWDARIYLGIKRRNRVTRVHTEGGDDLIDPKDLKR